MPILVIHNESHKLTFEFNGTSARIGHVSERKTPYMQRQFEHLGFEIYSNAMYGSPTNELILTFKNAHHGVEKVVNEKKDAIEIYGPAGKEIPTKGFKVKYLSKERPCAFDCFGV
jgi:hypothetical protein